MNDTQEREEAIRMYVVCRLDKTVEVMAMGQAVDVPLSFAEGMIGAMPVFKDKEAAEAFANGHCEVAEITTIPVDTVKQKMGAA